MCLLMRLKSPIVINVVVLLMIYISQISSQPIWSPHPDIRAGQVSIFDTVFLPLDTVKNQDITYSSPMVAPQINKASAVIAGFMNYLSTQMYINVTITDASSLTKMGLTIYMGANTYVKILDISYFSVEASTTSGYIEYSYGNYMTLALQTGTGYRPTTFAIETFSLDAGKIVPGISAFQLQNPNGLVNNLQVKSSISIPTGSPTSLLTHIVSVTQNNNLTAISIKTLKYWDTLYYQPITLANTTITNVMAFQFNSEITNISGFSTFDMISPSNYFNLQNQIYFGLTGFQFQAVDSRIFQLTPATNASFRNNLQTNTVMNFVDISVFLIAGVDCPVGAFFYMDQFTCVTACNVPPLKLLQLSNILCVNCDNTCDGCTAITTKCNACFTTTQFRVQASTPGICTCDTVNGYVEAGNDICQKCSVTIPGCSTCSNLTDCTACSAAFVATPSLNSTGTVCACPSGKYYSHPGYCLNKPGCLTANSFIGVQFCEVCDNANHFILNITSNNTCDCMQGYVLNSVTFICQHLCGNGITPSGLNACDDGNANSGDGCSSNCTIEYGYTCTVNVTGGISTCVQKQQISITFLYAQKNLLVNQATLVFSLLPAQPFLSQSTFQNSVQTNIPYKSSAIVFDATKSLIYLTVEYNEPLQANSYSVNFTFAGMSILSNDLYLNPNLKGINAKLEITTNPQQITIVYYVSLGVGAFALLLSIVVAIIGQKMMGIQLIMPIQAAFFTMATFPQQILAPLSALWPLKFSCGYNVLKSYELSSNYMLDPRISTMQFSGQYILNYNITFSILFLIILILLIILARVHYLQTEQSRLQGIMKKNEDEQIERKKNLHDLDKDQDEPKLQIKNKEDQNAQEDLQEVRENLKNWKNMMYMLLDRFFAILILNSLMIIVFCFYLQFSNLTYSSQVMDNSLNASFFFLTYATLIIGLYTIVYDYKTERLIVFNCSKGKYYIFYILIYFGYISVLGAVFQTSIGVYIISVFGLMPFILIPYQRPYGINQLFDFQNIVAFLCQLPFLSAIVVSLLLNLQVIPVDESLSFMFSYAILGTSALSIILTLIRMIKIIDFKKITFVQFSDRKKNNGNDKNKKKQKVALLELGNEKDWDQMSDISVRGILYQKEKQRNNQDFNLQIQNKQGYISLAKKNQFSKPEDIEDQDEDLDQIDKIKSKLRRQLKQKKIAGVIR